MRIGQKPHLAYQQVSQECDYQPGIFGDAGYRCTRCGQPQPAHAGAVQICPDAQDGDFAAMLCACCPACRQTCSQSAK